MTAGQCATRVRRASFVSSLLACWLPILFYYYYIICANATFLGMGAEGVDGDNGGGGGGVDGGGDTESGGMIQLILFIRFKY